MRPRKLLSRAGSTLACFAMLSRPSIIELENSNVDISVGQEIAELPYEHT